MRGSLQLPQSTRPPRSRERSGTPMTRLPDWKVPECPCRFPRPGSLRARACWKGWSFLSLFPPVQAVGSVENAAHGRCRGPAEGVGRAVPGLRLLGTVVRYEGGTTWRAVGWIGRPDPDVVLSPPEVLRLTTGIARSPQHRLAAPGPRRLRSVGRASAIGVKSQRTPGWRWRGTAPRESRLDHIPPSFSSRSSRSADRRSPAEMGGSSLNFRYSSMLLSST